ncbi:TOG array regulator of axonemal microtubules protein 1 [Histomonas meleagridis]|uniref:TOG array regulator of axonemal microtubules protein 1 n=1 Tax=Histomonas meleagridis TaxID=135588 RepID=UPI00355A2E06|nr:TOG array regulator of axonemal microtubules protein 1 [Histomonas meleagridis]KAH0806926.1 TOG array regulator of axonemal microtubules protein 1 [Histomonas meleagridis]
MSSGNALAFLEFLNSVDLSSTEVSIAAVSSLIDMVLYDNISLPENLVSFVDCFSTIIQNQDEIVSRSCLSIISLISNQGFLKAVFKELMLVFNSWNDRAKEIFLSFSFSFHHPNISEWEVFIPFAEKASKSNDELLASTASDFLFYLRNEDQDEDQPKAIMKLYASIDFDKQKVDLKSASSKRSTETSFKSTSNETNVRPSMKETNSKSSSKSTSFKSSSSKESNLKFPSSNEYSEYPDLDDGDLYNAEPPKSKFQLRSSIRSFSPSVSSYDYEEEEKPKVKKQALSQRSTPKSPLKQKEQTSLRTPTTTKNIRREETYSATASTPQRTLSKPKIRTRPNTLVNEEQLQLKKSKKTNSTPNITELIPLLKSKDWEKQNTAIESMSKLLVTDPLQFTPNCKDIWLDLLDIITSPRTILANNSLQFACDLYKEFSNVLCPQTSQFISTCLTLSCNSHQFIADGATALLFTIAENSPRNRVIKSFINGCSHRNSIARGKAIQCITIVMDDKGNVDDKELRLLIKSIAPLLRDTLMETREAAKRALKKLSEDERFLQIAKVVFNNIQDFNEMRKMIE